LPRVEPAELIVAHGRKDVGGVLRAAAAARGELQIAAFEHEASR
jgi:hypothetical protein